MAIIILLGIGSKVWSSVCTSIAVRAHYGKKGKWDKIYIVTDIPQQDSNLSVVISAFYEVVNGPIGIVVVNPVECLMNKCSPDLIVSYSSFFIEQIGVSYPLAKIPTTVLSYIIPINGGSDDDGLIVNIPIWRESLLFAMPKNSTHLSYSKSVMKSLSTDEILRRALEIEEKRSEIRKRQEKARAKTEKIRKETVSLFEKRSHRR